MLPLLQSACMKAGCVATKVVSPTARPTLAMLVSGTKAPGKKGVRNSALTQTVNRQLVVNRKRCGGRGGRGVGVGAGGC